MNPPPLLDTAVDLIPGNYLVEASAEDHDGHTAEGYFYVEDGQSECET